MRWVEAFFYWNWNRKLEIKIYFERVDYTWKEWNRLWESITDLERVKYISRVEQSKIYFERVD